jgi:hypothetical protein
MIASIRTQVADLRPLDSYAERSPLVDKVLRRLDLLTERVNSVAEDRGRKGGLKTAERGPDYFRQIAAKRKTRAGGRPKKQPEVA